MQKRSVKEAVRKAVQKLNPKEKIMARQRTVETDANPGNPENHVAESGTKSAKVKKERKVRDTMARGWGETFHRAATEGLDQAAVEQIMIERFPEKEATVRKWTQWYKNFYNMGRIKGFENPVQVVWPSQKSERAIARKAEREAAREAARAEKAAAKEQARAEKLAEKARRQEEREAKKQAASA